MEKGQLTLFDCRKVVSGGKGGSWVVFSESDILTMKGTLLNPESSMHLLLNTLRKLDCYRLQLSDISGTDIGRAVATVAGCHPRLEVSKLASALLHKWRAHFDAALFACMEYDAAAAAAAPEGDPSEFQLQAPPPPPPPPPEAPTRVQPSRKDRATRYREEADYLEGSDFEGISESESDAASDDDDWQPGQRRRMSGGAASGGKKARQ